MTVEYTDEQYDLIKASQAGDEKAMARLVESHASSVFAFLCHLSSDTVLAEDLAQETMLRCLQSLKYYEFRAPFRAWLFRIAVNLFRDHRRRMSVRRWTQSGLFDDEQFNLPSSDPGPHQQAEQQERSQHLYRALDQLSPQLRTVVILRDIQELSYEEIAQSLKWRMGTVKSRLFRARKELADIMRPFWEEQK